MRRMQTIPVTLAAVLLLGIPAGAGASGPIERIVERDHRTEKILIAGDDICGEIFGPAGRGAGTVYITETGHRTITTYEDRFHVVDVENGTYWYDFDDPTMTDVGGHYVSPFSFVLHKNGDAHVMESLVEFEGGIRILSHYHLLWKDDAPFVERVFNWVSGCP